MKNEYTSILFAIYSNQNEVRLSWLLEHVVSDEVNRNEVQQYISELISAKLIRLYLVEGNPYLSLTDIGKETVMITADIISNTLINQWQQGNLEI